MGYRLARFFSFFFFVGIHEFVGSVAGPGWQECLVLGAALMPRCWQCWDGPQ